MQVLWPVENIAEDHGQFPGIMSICALLQQRGFTTEVVPAERDAILERVGDPKRTVLAFSTPTTYSQRYRDLNLQVRKHLPELRSIFGGPHPTFFSEMIHDPGVEVICIGDGELPMLEYMSSLAAGERRRDIPNLWFNDDGRIVKNPLRPLLEDLDELPVPEHEIFRRAQSPKVAQALVITSRGCPHSCTYCFNHAFRKLYRGKGKAIRRRSVAHVMRELRQVKKQGYRYIRFLDDLFILSTPWVEAFCEQYKREIALPFCCQGRPNFVTKEIMESLRDAGCHRMLLGVETGNEAVRSAVLKRKMDAASIYQACEIIRASGVKLLTTNLLAIPGGSFEADWETLEMNAKCRPAYPMVQMLVPFPKTEIFDTANRLGMLDEKQARDIESLISFGSSSPLHFADPKDARRISNLLKLFAFTVRFPALAPVVRRLVEFPSNPLFDAVFFGMLTYARVAVLAPPRIGLPATYRQYKAMLRRKLGLPAPR